jgi:hypothetical protein
MDSKKGNAGKKRSPDSDEGIGSSILYLCTETRHGQEYFLSNRNFCVVSLGV